MQVTGIIAMRRRRVLAIGIAAVLALGTSNVVSAPAEASSHASRSVTSGDARFEVLSPTLIRTEYAGDRQFTDGATYNVIGRSSFARTRFTKTVRNGWLTLDTGAMTLKYKQGSGAFTEKNLVVALTTDSGQRVTGSPWTTQSTPECTTGVLCEAETLGLEGLSLATNHPGFTGTGFAAGFESVGNSLTFDVTASTAGPQDLDLRYANSQGGDGKVTTRTLSVSVDGTKTSTLSLAPGSSWDD
jgi:hypothetical protein